MLRPEDKCPQCYIEKDGIWWNNCPYAECKDPEIQKYAGLEWCHYFKVMAKMQELMNLAMNSNKGLHNSDDKSFE